MAKRSPPIVITAGSCVAIEGDWRLHVAAADPVLRGIYTINGHDYLHDGKSLTAGAPRVVSAGLPK